MRCPTCGAWNPTDAAWCGQCYGRFTADGPPDGAPGGAPGGAPDGSPEAPGPPAPARTSSDPASPAADARSGDVRTVDGEVEWRCGACERWNPLLASACAVCATPRSGFGEPASATPRDVSPTLVLAASVVWPGAGHVAVGRTGTGLGRALLWVLWLGAAIGLWRATGGAGGPASRAPAVALLLGAAALWLGTVLDAVRLGDGRSEEVLRPRVLGLLVAVVTGGLLLSLLLVAP